MTVTTDGHDADSAFDDGERWIEVFRNRGCWTLNRDTVDQWVADNRTFFSLVEARVPRNRHVLDVGCGPGRHALGIASLGYGVTGVDIDPTIVAQAQSNALSAGVEGATFILGDMTRLDVIPLPRPLGAITHGGLIEHLPSAERIREVLMGQLTVAPTVIFDVPLRTDDNLRLFAKDRIFRQVWTAKEWLDRALAGFRVVAWVEELRSSVRMTDDLVVALERQGR